ncbi:hypothetical protein BDFB_009914 [Asbolus verrucosus]|uniref:Uncharacterized protein n=1 Tax=Asbolus verrucosus TaxID=1661398 RepID=A0A482W9B9_ASBVE|nr:hypothetical protein BDFB_009914 [Asbolus verrucosus]
MELTRFAWCLFLVVLPVSGVRSAPCDCEHLQNIHAPEQSCLLNQLLHIITHLVSCTPKPIVTPESYKKLLEATNCTAKKDDDRPTLPPFILPTWRIPSLTDSTTEAPKQANTQVSAVAPAPVREVTVGPPVAVAPLIPPDLVLQPAPGTIQPPADEIYDTGETDPLAAKFNADTFFIPVLKIHGAPCLSAQELKDYLFRSMSCPKVKS